MEKNWKKISRDFTSELQKKWEDLDFSYEETKEWINIGLKTKDADFANYLYRQHQSPEKFLSAIKERGNIKWEIEEIENFPIWFSDNCSIIITKKNSKFGASLLIYDGEEKIPWCINFLSNSNSSLEGIKAEISLFREKLNSNDSPVLALLEIANEPIYLSKIVKKVEISKHNSSGEYIKKYDIIEIKMDGLNANHAAIFLGRNETSNENEVVHISGSGNYFDKFFKGNINWRAKIDTWENFLNHHQQAKKIFLNRPIIPFKKQNLVKRHIDIAIEAALGLSKYDLFSNNCEHFSTLCVGSVPFSKQVNNLFSFSWLWGDKLEKKWIKAEIKKNNNYFNELLEEKRKSLEEINEKYQKNSLYEKANQEKISKIKSSINIEEVDKIKDQSIDIIPDSSEIKESLEEAVIESANRQKELIKEQNKEKEDFLSSCKNILIVGRTGNGKSTLANVLSNTNYFVEKASSTSLTKEAESKIFEVEEEKYRVVDTIGIGDTRLSEKEVLDRIAKTALSIKHGLHQVLFVVGGRFDETELKAYELLQNYILDGDIANYTTVVRTNFANFRTAKKCEEDTRNLLSQNERLKKIIDSCQKKVVYVDNPPADIPASDRESEKEKADREKTIELNKKRRDRSRKILLSHLKNCNELYGSNNLDKLVIRIVELVAKAELLQEELEKEEQKFKDRKDIEDIMKKIIKQNIEEKKEMINSIVEEIRIQTKQSLIEKGKYEELLSEFIERLENIEEKIKIMELTPKK